MKLMVFCVHDKSVGAYLPPFFARASGEAIRSFGDACNNDQHQFSRHALDYTLMKLGEWDDTNGLFVCGEPQRVVSAAECVVDPMDRKAGDFFKANAAGSA